MLLVAVSPAVHRPDGGRRLAHVGTETIRDVDSSLASLSAGVAERMPVPPVRPMQTASFDPGDLAALSWLVLVLAAVLVLGGVGLTRRDRAPPLRLLVNS